jgi:hypothetical protein
MSDIPSTEEIEAKALFKQVLGFELTATINWPPQFGYDKVAKAAILSWPSQRGGLTHECMVPMEGVEPTHSYEYQILSLARLPIPPHRLMEQVMTKYNSSGAPRKFQTSAATGISSRTKSVDSAA